MWHAGHPKNWSLVAPRRGLAGQGPECVRVPGIPLGVALQCLLLSGPWPQGDRLCQAEVCSLGPFLRGAQSGALPERAGLVESRPQDRALRVSQVLRLLPP